MKLEVFFSPDEIENEYDLREKAIVVVDVLRASSSIITAIHHGARQVIPVATVSDAIRLSKDLFDDSTILCGERQGKLIDGFDIDNSPASYRPETVKDKSLLFTTTNGSAAILKTKYARNVLIGGFINVSATVAALVLEENVAVLCAGDARRFATEDALCAGMLISMLSQRDHSAMLNDAAVWSKRMYERSADSLLSAIRESAHAKSLDNDGFGPDVTFCATRDVYSDVPRFDGTVIRKSREPKRPIQV